MAKVAGTIGGRELFFYANNVPQFVHDRFAIGINLATKKAQKRYSRERAIKAYMQHANRAAKAYTKEFATRGDKWNVLFDTADRRSAAIMWREWFEAEHKLGHFEPVLPKKYQKAATKKASQRAFALSAQTRDDGRQALGSDNPDKGKWVVCWIPKSQIGKSSPKWSSRHFKTKREAAAHERKIKRTDPMAPTKVREVK